MVKTATRPVEQAPFTPSEKDIVNDILAMVCSMQPGFSAALAMQINTIIRAKWGGDRPYIARRSGDGTSARNAAIKRDYWQNGAHIPLLERRYGLSSSHLWRIIKS